MKFANKIIWSCLVTLAVLFSLGSTFMIYRNHGQLLQTTIDTQLSNHDIEVYSLESGIFQDMMESVTDFGKNEKLVQERMIYYLKQFQAVSSGNAKQYALLSQEDEVLYSTLPKEGHDELLLPETQAYSVKHLEQQYFLVLKAPVHAGENQYHLITVYDITSLYQERNRQLKDLTIITIALYIAAYFILKYLSKRLTCSIYKLNEVSKRIAEGQYEERTNIESQDEIGELSKSFDEMASMNEKTIHQLQESVIQREEFMASFSHEIKIPMTAILGFSDTLRTGVCDVGTQQKAASYIYHEGKRLENLSYTLMTLFSLSNQEIELQPVYLPKVVNQLQNYYHGQNVKNPLYFSCDDIYVKGQQELLFVLLRNLIDNACKASPEGEEIEITMKQERANVMICVKDTGIGMDEESIQKATDAFYMADKSRSRSQGGAGLGLTIVKRICEIHRTNLMFDSEIKKGTTVSFSLEVAQNE